MPITAVAGRGGGTTTAMTLTSPTAIAVGNVLVLAVATDNAGTSGAAPTLGVTDPRGNTWTSLGSSLRDPGLVDEGAFLRLFATTVGTAYQTGDVLTLTASPTPARVVWGVYEFAGVRATPPAVAAVAANGSNVSSGFINTTPTAAGQLVLAGAAVETNAAITGDADTTGGAPWTTMANAASDSGTAATSIALIAQFKIPTTAVTQAHEATWSGTADYANLSVVLAATAYAITATHEATIDRVRLAIADVSPVASSVRVQRSTDGVAWTTVRGASALTPTAQTLYDYEYTPGVVNTYRAQALTAGGAVIATATTTITHAPAGVWLKNAARPYLNRAVTVHQYSDITRPARGGVLEILGRRDPVAVTEVRGSRRFDLILRADTTDEVAAIELALSFGDPVYLQPPAGSAVPGPLWAFVGDVTTDKGGEHQLPLRFLTLPLIEVEAPDAAIVGTGITWAGVTGAYATWSAVTAAKATWLALMESISDPADEVVG